ncbi:MAG: Acetyltransferase family [Pseudomonadota bacterium]|jgi:ribosomal protein S18 acetylase RimI-like enzyme
MPDLRLRQPLALGPRLFFEVYSGPNAIAYAHLSTRTTGRPLAHTLVADETGEMTAPGITYYLKNIEVSEAYRNRGVGSALLHEVVRFCREARVSAIYGEAKGDVDALRKWYAGSGFDLIHQNHIRLQLEEAA